MGIPIRNNADLPAGVGNLPLRVIHDGSSSDPFFYVKDEGGAVVAFGLNTAALFGANGVLAAEFEAGEVGTPELAAGGVTKVKLAGGFLKVALAAGGASGADVTVAAIAVGDELVAVLSFTTAAAIATVADRTAEYAIQAGGLDKAAGTNETNNQLVIIYLDLT